ncbi:MAG: hypothetical protein JNM25_06785 [Planctomycetes bacterium]|nr:hypothetical protein [Planctomycetota bacterium]
MPPTPHTATVTFCRRVAVGAFAAGALRALLVASVAAAAVLLGLRLFGRHAAPQPAWAFAAAPVLAFGWWNARRQRLGRAAAAAHLDRRLGLGGLLICRDEGVELDAPQQRQLAAGLVALPTALPRIRWRALLPWPAAALLLAAGIALLPPPPAPPLPLSQSAAAAELDRLQERMRDLFARGEVPADTRHELERTLQELQHELAAADVPQWRDLDELERRLDREGLLQAAAAEAPAQAGPVSTPGAPTDPLTPAALAAAAEALAAVGRLDGLPAELQAMLQQAQRDGAFAADLLPQDAEALRRLAAAMAAAAQQPGALQDLAALGGDKLADLRDVLSQFGGGSAPGEGGSDVGGEGEGAGRGGVDRGPGHAALALTEAAAGGADGAMPLPPGQPVPTEWVPLGSRRIEPETAPVANTGGGGQGASGLGGASWQLQLAPRHRAIVRRYFDAGAPANGEDKR